MHFNLREKKHRHNETPSKSAHTKEKKKKIVQSVNMIHVEQILLIFSVLCTLIFQKTCPLNPKKIIKFFT